MRRVAVVGAVLVLTSACGADPDAGGTGETTTPTVTTTFVLECPEPVAVEEAADITALLDTLEWGTSGPYGGGPLPITPDLVVRGTVVLESGEVPVPESCLGRPDCLHEAGFASSELRGVTLDGSPEGDFLGLAGRLTLTDTTIRLRPVMVDTHPGPANYVPTIRILEPCGTPCGSAASMCPADGVCYDTSRSPSSFCLFCEGKAAPECACSATPGTVPDGEACSFFRSGDVICAGRCRSGTCVSEECP